MNKKTKTREDSIVSLLDTLGCAITVVSAGLVAVLFSLAVYILSQVL